MQQSFGLCSEATDVNHQSNFFKIKEAMCNSGYFDRLEILKNTWKELYAKKKGGLPKQDKELTSLDFPPQFIVGEQCRCYIHI